MAKYDTDAMEYRLRRIIRTGLIPRVESEGRRRWKQEVLDEAERQGFKLAAPQTYTKHFGSSEILVRRLCEEEGVDCERLKKFDQEEALAMLALFHRDTGAWPQINRNHKSTWDSRTVQEAHSYGIALPPPFVYTTFWCNPGLANKEAQAFDLDAWLETHREVDIEPEVPLNPIEAVQEMILKPKFAVGQPVLVRRSSNYGILFEPGLVHMIMVSIGANGHLYRYSVSFGEDAEKTSAHFDESDVLAFPTNLRTAVDTSPRSPMWLSSALLKFKIG